MVEPVTEDVEQRIRDAQDKFNAGMGADGDASPYPLLRELRAQSPVHPGWPELGVPASSGDGPPTFTAYTFDAVKAVFTDNITFSTRCYEAVVRPLQGPTILEMQDPEHSVYRRLHEFAFARSSMRRWDAELVGPLVDRTVDKLRDANRADLVETVFMPIPVRVIAALLGLPEAYVIGMLLLLMVGKMFATSLTIGIGGSGGVFAPTLFIGAMAGSAFGLVAHEIFPSAAGSAGAYGLIGMGAALGGATGAPITAVIILFELTGEYSIILPLMAAVVMAAGVAHLLSKETIYTAKLWRRGIVIENPPSVVQRFTAAEVALPPPNPLHESTTLTAAATMLAEQPLGILPVTDNDAQYRGCVTAEDVAEALDGHGPPKTVADIVHSAPTVGVDDDLPRILGALAGHGGTGLPVVNRDKTALVGWITYETVLARMHPDGRERPPSD